MLFVRGKPACPLVVWLRHCSPSGSRSRLSTRNPVHVLFIGRDEIRRLRGLLKGLKKQPVVTVRETENFVDQGGMIGFCIEGNNIRFEINL